MLTKRQIDLIAPNGKVQKYFDHDGLNLVVTKRGAKSFRYDFRWEGRRSTVTFGLYPEVTLDDARDMHRRARLQLRQGINPAIAKKLEKATGRADLENTFKAAADAWFASKCHLRSKVWQDAHRLLLNRDLFPILADIPLRALTAAGLLGVLEKAARRATERTGRDGSKTAERVRQTAIQVLNYARLRLGLSENVAVALKGWTTVPAVVHRAYLKSTELPKFFAALREYPGYPSTVFAAELLFRTMVRKRELTDAQWAEFDLRNRMWTIPPERMKLPTEQKSDRHNAHEVPLSRQAVRLLEELRAFSSGSKFVFPSNSSIDKPMSPTTLNAMFDRMGFHGRFTPHGIRATASTILNDRGFRPDAIERQLAHFERNGSRRAYNHAEYLKERRQMMQAWSDILDEIRGDTRRRPHGG